MKVDPANYPGAAETIERGIGRYEGTFHRTVLRNDSIIYASVVRRDATAGTALVWEVNVLRTPFMPSNTKMLVDLWRYDCRAKTGTGLHQLAIASNFDVISRTTPDLDVTPMAPGSGGENIMKFACGEATDALEVKDLLVDSDQLFAIGR